MGRIVVPIPTTDRWGVDRDANSRQWRVGGCRHRGVRFGKSPRSDVLLVRLRETLFVDFAVDFYGFINAVAEPFSGTRRRGRHCWEKRCFIVITPILSFYRIVVTENVYRRRWPLSLSSYHRCVFSFLA